MDKYISELRHEKIELECKIARLALFLYRKEQLKLNAFPWDDRSLRCPVEMLKSQLEKMLSYLSSLDVRLKIAEGEYVPDCFFANEKDKEEFQNGKR